jgi:hypothetical protein
MNTTPIIPLSAILSWPQPNYVNPERRTGFFPFAIAFEVITTVMVFARLIAKFRRGTAGFGLDDATIVLAWVRPFTSFVPRCAKKYRS